MNRPDLGRLGVAGVAGIALALFCASFALSAVLPAQRDLERMRRLHSQLQATAAQLAPIVEPRSAAEHPVLQKPASAATALEQFAATAQKFNIPTEQASYRFVRDEGAARYEVSLPVKTSYQSLRGFLEEALALSTAATLDELTLRRASAVDPVVEASIKLSFHFDGP